MPNCHPTLLCCSISFLCMHSHVSVQRTARPRRRGRHSSRLRRTSTTIEFAIRSTTKRACEPHTSTVRVRASSSTRPRCNRHGRPRRSCCARRKRSTCDAQGRSWRCAAPSTPSKDVLCANCGCMKQRMDHERSDGRGREAGRQACGAANEEAMEHIDVNRCIESTNERDATQKEGDMHENIESHTWDVPGKEVAVLGRCGSHRVITGSGWT